MPRFQNAASWGGRPVPVEVRPEQGVDAHHADQGEDRPAEDDLHRRGRGLRGQDDLVVDQHLHDRARQVGAQRVAEQVLREGRQAVRKRPVPLRDARQHKARGRRQHGPPGEEQDPDEHELGVEVVGERRGEGAGGGDDGQGGAEGRGAPSPREGLVAAPLVDEVAAQYHAQYGRGPGHSDEVGGDLRVGDLVGDLEVLRRPVLHAGDDEAEGAEGEAGPGVDRVGDQAPDLLPRRGPLPLEEGGRVGVREGRPEAARDAGALGVGQPTQYVEAAVVEVGQLLALWLWRAALALLTDTDLLWRREEQDENAAAEDVCLDLERGLVVHVGSHQVPRERVPKHHPQRHAALREPQPDGPVVDGCEDGHPGGRVDDDPAVADAHEELGNEEDVLVEEVGEEGRRERVAEEAGHEDPLLVVSLQELPEDGRSERQPEVWQRAQYALVVVVQARVARVVVVARAPAAPGEALEDGGRAAPVKVDHDLGHHEPDEHEACQPRGVRHAAQRLRRHLLPPQLWHSRGWTVGGTWR
mmetsp:Transcript_48296/g.136480  ORF Transcript_48296/g.136480 Transcript_48296/m.136480 type:complete len:527 (-) Transcript_48296:22-1602(-)